MNLEARDFFQRDFHFRWKAFPVKTSANLIILAPYFDSKAPPPAAPDSFNYYTYSCSRGILSRSLVARHSLRLLKIHRCAQ